MSNDQIRPGWTPLRVLSRSWTAGVVSTALLGAVAAVAIAVANGVTSGIADLLAAAIVGVLLMVGIGIFAGLAGGIALLSYVTRSSGPELGTAKLLAAGAGAATAGLAYLWLFSSGDLGAGWVALTAIVPAAVVGGTLNRGVPWIVRPKAVDQN